MLPNEAYSQLLHPSSVLQHHAAMRMKTPNFSFSLKCISGPDGAKNENGSTSGPATCEIWLSGDLAMASLGNTQYKEEIDWRLRKKKIVVVMLLSNCQRVCIHLFFGQPFQSRQSKGRCPLLKFVNYGCQCAPYIVLRTTSNTAASWYEGTVPVHLQQAFGLQMQILNQHNKNKVGNNDAWWCQSQFT